MSENIIEKEGVLPTATLIAQLSISKILEESVRLIEREYETAFRLRYQKSMDDKDRLYLRKLSLKICADYLAAAIDTMENYNQN